MLTSLCARIYERQLRLRRSSWKRPACLDGLDHAVDPRGVEILRPDGPWSVRNGLGCGETTGRNQVAHGRRADPKPVGGLSDGQHRTVRVRRVDGNIVGVTKTDDALLGPRVAGAGVIAEAVEEACDLGVG